MTTYDLGESINVNMWSGYLSKFSFVCRHYGGTLRHLKENRKIVNTLTYDTCVYMIHLEMEINDKLR